MLLVILKELATLAALGLFISAVFVWAEFFTHQSIFYQGF